MDQRLAMLKEITDIHGVPGHERAVSAYIEEQMKAYCQVDRDNLGSIICKKTGTAEEPRVMLAGHMDEIGFMVKLITKEGFIKFQPLGGWWDQVLLAQRVIVKTHKGDLPGIIGSKPPHILPAEERKKIVTKDDMFIDIGAGSKEEAEEFGVRPGDPVVPFSPFQTMANEKLLMAKAWDDRIGCALFMDVIRELDNEDHPNQVFGVGTVQEEVGLRGATTSVECVKPHVGLALEVSIAGDMPGISEDKAPDKLGKGPSIILYDGSMIPNVKLRDLAISTAKDEDIPIQFTLMPGGGTDAGRIHTYSRGVPSLVIGVPTRYIHSHTGILHRDDYDSTVRLIKALIKRLDADTIASLVR